jgi:hypothetical protein
MLIENYDLQVESVPCEPGSEEFAAIVRLTWTSAQSCLT